MIRWFKVKKSKTTYEYIFSFVELIKMSYEKRNFLFYEFVENKNGLNYACDINLLFLILIISKFIIDLSIIKLDFMSFFIYYK